MPGRLAKWQVILSQYEIVYMIRKVVKGSVIADLLAKNPINDYEALDFEFPDEYINAVGDDAIGPDDVWEMYFDGVVNLAGNGIGAVLVAPDGKHFPIAVKLRFSCTNNVAEYKACVSGLQATIEMKIKKLEEFEEISFTHLSRDKNQFADALATLAVMTQMEEGQITQLLQIKARSELAYCFMIEEETDGKPWYHDVQLYNLVSPWPFAMWDIDVIGPINPKASNGHMFILVAIDYFTKWVEATSYAHITQKTFLKFLKNNIICRYGLPGEIVTDNAKNLNGSKI
ncbi:uncharacterized protein LOC131178475 [Hevea brasiliensis]|uniref:uncharacterized protein LOC131178475 n=1 Tax=Hevea brasiliensis TaxID=3981 RepID=UPI0025F1B827|nr:uncharacterized protein LOC131178475 [Hevea brasiliensis]